MSRLLLNNSPAALQRAAAVTCAAAGTTTTTQCRAAPSIHVVRRWKSLLHAAQRQQQLAVLSQASALNASSGLFANSTEYQSRAASTSAAALYASAAATTTNSNQTNSLTTARREKSTMSAPKPTLQLENINPNFITMQYAVRGPLVIRAGEIEKELERGVKKPFKQVFRANIGDCHATGQKPITFVRQLLALTYEPRLLESSDYPEDVKERARILLNGCQGGSVGSYTDSVGLEVVRRQVAEFIEDRDHIPADYQNIFLTAGASPGIKSILSLLRCDIDGKRPGVMVPIPQYPLYSATIEEYNMVQVGYYLEEETNWSLSRAELQRSLDEAKKHCNPRALAVINPGNPTGQVLTHANIVEIIKFAYENKLFLLSDEVYQSNIYDKDSKFHSFKKVMHEMGAPYNGMELVSFMSTSKGYFGECGIRGGYMEILNMAPDVKAVLMKSLSASLCPTTAGQVTLSALVHPPKKGEPSYEQFNSEKNEVLKTLKQRGELIYDTFSQFEGFKVNVPQGAMYMFPQIVFPPKALEAAKAKNLPADTFYAFELLEATGICIVSGSGFGQKPNTYHFRTTILPQPEQLKVIMKLFKQFNADFMQKYK